MKYFIIVLFLIGFFGLAFAYPGEEVEISVSTDKKSYKPGEILTIKGTGAHSYSIWAKIISPEGDEIIELKFLAPISGEFYTAWIIPKTIAPALICFNGGVMIFSLINSVKGRNFSELPRISKLAWDS